MLALICKTLLKTLLVLSLYNDIQAQSPKQPTLAGFSSLRQQRGIYSVTGVAAIDATTWFICDSNHWALHPPKLFFDSLHFRPSMGNPDNILWINSSTGELYHSHRDSVRFWYSQLDGTPTIPTFTSQLTNNSGFLTSINAAMVTSALTYTPYNSTNPNGYQTTTGVRNSISVTTLGSGPAGYNSGTGVINIPTYTFTPVSDSTVSVTRAINSSTFTPHATKQVTVSYNIRISCTATIGSASAGKVLFQYSTNGGGVWIDAGEVENSNTVSLAVVLNSTTVQSGFINWTIPPGALCRLVPTSSGTTTITWIRGQDKYNGY